MASGGKIILPAASLAATLDILDSRKGGFSMPLDPQSQKFLDEANCTDSFTFVASSMRDFRQFKRSQSRWNLGSPIHKISIGLRPIEDRFHWTFFPGFFYGLGVSGCGPIQ